VEGGVGADGFALGDGAGAAFGAVVVGAGGGVIAVAAIVYGFLGVFAA